jgi:hypothetical protein
MTHTNAQSIPSLTQAELARFFKYVRKGADPGDCWMWTGGAFSTGYGAFGLRGKTRHSHRVSYRIHIGNTRKHLDHTCHDPATCAGGVECPHRRCVNPAHLKPATIKENVLRGGGLSAQNAKKTHCKRGHEFTAENTIIASDGSRHCRQCQRDKTNLYRQQNRERILARRRELREHVVHDPITCPACGKAFTPVRSTATVCPACRESGSDRRRAYQREYMRARRAR